MVNSLDWEVLSSGQLEPNKKLLAANNTTNTQLVE